jgi:hypothetical protein
MREETFGRVGGTVGDRPQRRGGGLRPLPESVPLFQCGPAVSSLRSSTAANRWHPWRDGLMQRGLVCFAIGRGHTAQDNVTLAPAPFCG